MRDWRVTKRVIITTIVIDILREFSPNLIGVSHGMGSYENLPFEQLSVSTKGATTKSMPKQVSW